MRKCKPTGSWEGWGASPPPSRRRGRAPRPPPARCVQPPQLQRTPRIFVHISAEFRSFSAVSAPIFARKYAFCCIFQNLPDYPAEFLKFGKFLQILQHLQNFAKFQKFQLDSLVDFEKCCKTHIFLQKSVPIQPKTNNSLPKFCQKLVTTLRVVPRD